MPEPTLPSDLTQQSAAKLDALWGCFRGQSSFDEPALLAVLDQLVAQFPPEILLESARRYLGRLGSPEAFLSIRLIEAYGGETDYQFLASAIIEQPGAPAEGVWDALETLRGVGRLDDDPELVDRWEEINDLLQSIEEGEDSLLDLIEELESNECGPALALQGLADVEPEFRREIVQELGRAGGDAPGPGLVEFMRLLAFAGDESLRSMAMNALSSQSLTRPEVESAWASIVAHHPEPEAVDQARAALGDREISALRRRRELTVARPVLAGSLVSAVNGVGEGLIVLIAHQGSRRAAAAFTCDVLEGVRSVVGDVVIEDESTATEELLAAFKSETEADFVTGVETLAVSLLGASLLIRPKQATPALRYWIESTLGPDFRPRVFEHAFAQHDYQPRSVDETTVMVRDLLDACPSWLDSSPITFGLAEELQLREADPTPRPDRDSGAFRFLFEHRLAHSLERYRQMLFWMAAFWEAADENDLSHAAVTIGLQLADPQHAVPSHPFATELMTRSLLNAQQRLRAGDDPRR